jgi:hypothetical protein
MCKVFKCSNFENCMVLVIIISTIIQHQKWMSHIAHPNSCNSLTCKSHYSFANDNQFTKYFQ